MKDSSRIILSKGKEQSLLRSHPWVFSGAIKKIDGKPGEGDVVTVVDHKEQFIGRGHFANGSIAVRMLTFMDEQINAEFWKQRIGDAFRYREETGITRIEDTNAYRLVFAEGDHLPGLIIDLYDSTAVMQAHSYGMWRSRELIANALRDVMGTRLGSVYDKSVEALPGNKGFEVHDGYLIKVNEPNGIIREYGNSFYVDWAQGQKTGFFLDQRENRKLLASFAKGKRVINAFSYSGGFSVYAMQAGAVSVHSVDSSRRAIEMAVKNMELNQKEWDGSKYFTEDVFDYFNKCDEKADVIILDPPAFAKHQRATHNAIMGYKRLNLEAIRKINPGGILFTFSCSQAIDRKTFHSTVMSAAINARRKVRVMHQLSQPADHPVNIFHPEGEYLKGLVLYVE